MFCCITENIRRYIKKPNKCFDRYNRRYYILLQKLSCPKCLCHRFITTLKFWKAKVLFQQQHSILPKKPLKLQHKIMSIKLKNRSFKRYIPFVHCRLQLLFITSRSSDPGSPKSNFHILL